MITEAGNLENRGRRQMQDERAVEQQIADRRAQLALYVTRQMTWGAGAGAVVLLFAWAFQRQSLQLLGMAGLFAALALGMGVYATLSRHGQETLARVLVFGLTLLTCAGNFALAPQMGWGALVGYVLVIVMGYFFLGGQTGGQVTLLTIALALGGLVAQQGGWRLPFAPLDATLGFGLGLAFLAGMLAAVAELVRQTIHAQESYIRSTKQEQRDYLQSMVQKYTEYMDDVARGNLSARLTLNSSDADTPLIALGEGLNHLTQGVQRMILQIREAANNLSSATAQILAATAEQAAGASQQSAAISETTTTVDELKTIAEQASLRVQEVSSAAQRNVDVSQSGQRAVQDTIESMEQIKERVEGIAENILALSEQTQQIGEIIATVNEIAAQSNVLALNASVEAARAGEHGKGFAVVAVEVRNLAEQSRQATAQVKAILSEIQKATNATVMATEEGTKGVDRGVQLAAQARQAIDQLSSVINESAQAALQVVAGGRQQLSGIEQIAMAMQNIDQATVQSLVSTRQMERAAQNLNQLARQLTETVSQYRL